MKRLPWKRLIVLLVLGIAIAVAITYREHLRVEVVEGWVEAAGPAAPLAFMGLYVAGAMLFLPGSVFTLAGGALFGPIGGTFYSLTGATAGGLVAFFIARYVASDWVARRAGGRLKQLVQGVEEEGWRFVAFVRLVPIFPFNLLNYALGLTRIRAIEFLVASYLTMLPGAAAYAYLGYVGREAAAGAEGLIRKGLLALGLLAIAALLPRWIRKLRQRRRGDDGIPPAEAAPEEPNGAGGVPAPDQPSPSRGASGSSA